MRQAPPRIINEWDIEVLDGPGGDILDHDFQGVGASFPGVGDETNRVVLVHDIWVEDDLQDRSWAYLRPDGTLPERFGYPTAAGGEYDQHGPLVPKKYHQQVAAWHKRQARGK